MITTNLRFRLRYEDEAWLVAVRERRETMLEAVKRRARAIARAMRVKEQR